MRTYKAIKYTLFVCCYILWVASGVLLAIGIYAKLAKEKDVVDTLTADPALLLLTVGSLMFIITFLGCFGALRDVPIILKMFIGILLVILLLQIAAAAMGFIFSDKVLGRTEQLMKKAIVRYREDMDLENVIDFVQKKFQCCGVDGYLDWSRNVYFNCSGNNPSLEACGVPFSCCIRQPNETVFNSMCGYEVQRDNSSASERIYTNGCLKRMVRWGERNLLLVGGMSVSMLFLEICMVALAAVQLDQIQKIQLKKKKATNSTVY